MPGLICGLHTGKSPKVSPVPSAKKSDNFLVLVAIYISLYFNIYAVVGRYLITKDDPVGAAPPTNVSVVVDIV